MVAVGAVMVIIGVIIIVMCLYLGDGRAKGAALLGVIAGIFVSSTGLATTFKSWIASLFT